MAQTPPEMGTEPNWHSIGVEVGNLVLDLVREGERALVVAGVARLDVALENLLRRVMKHQSGSSDNLFDVERPLGTFASKIALAHRLDLLTDDIERALQLVRRIRNDFAHSVARASLSEASHSGRLKELARRCEVTPGYRSLREETLAVSRIGATVTEQVAEFAASLATLIIAIECAAMFAQPFEPTFKARLQLDHLPRVNSRA